MNTKTNSVLLFVFFMMLAHAPVRAYSQAYPEASTDDVEVFVVPPARWLATAAPGAYFDRSGMLFGRLFDYISTHDIDMTVPVEGRLDQAQMRFYLSPNVTSSKSSGEVKILDMPSRRVARLGGTGSYSAKNIARVRNRVESWIAQNPEWQVSGPAYAVFWNGPFTPWFLKRFEVHLRIVPAAEPPNVGRIGEQEAS